MNGSFYKNFRNLSVLSAFSMLLFKIKKLLQKTNFSYIVSSFGTAHNGLCFLVRNIAKGLEGRKRGECLNECSRTNT